MIIDTQKHDIEFIKKYNNQKETKAFTHSFGCAQNVADGEKINGILKELGYTLTEDKNEADLILFNTCAVRKGAEEKVFGHIGLLKPLKKKNNDLIIVVCGCMAQRPEIQKRLKEHYPFVNVVFGTGSMNSLPTFLYEYITKHKNVFHGSIENSFEAKFPVIRTDKLKATVTIMQGCNNFCSYCIVPYVRGREISRNFEEIICEVKELVDNGYKDITLLGQNVNSYKDGSHTFPKLLSILDKIPGEYRLRFMTSHPKDCSFELIDTIANSEHICHYIHLPVQCGSNRVLKTMNRHYTIEHYMDLIDYAKKVMNDVSFSSDIIVGFPGETYEDFKMTYNLVNEVRYMQLFTFIFSPREGTKAWSLADDIPYNEKSKWLQELVKLQEDIAYNDNQKFVGKTLKIMIDTDTAGRTESNIIVRIPNSEKYIGQFLNVKITKAHRAELEGELL